MANAVSEEAETLLAQAFLQFHNLYRFTECNKKTEHTSNKCGNLRFREYLLLFHLSYHQKGKPGHGGMTASELSYTMNVKPPTINPLIFKLEQMGLITRKADEKDRRYLKIELTSAGMSIIEKKEAAFKKNFHELACYLGDEKSRLLAELANEVYMFVSLKKAKCKKSNTAK